MLRSRFSSRAIALATILVSPSAAIGGGDDSQSAPSPAPADEETKALLARPASVDGVDYIVTNEVIDGAESIVFTDGEGRRWMKEEIQARSRARGKIAPALQVRLSETSAEAPIRLILTLTRQPTRDVSRAVFQTYEQSYRELVEELRRADPQPDIAEFGGTIATTAEERAIVGSMEQTPEHIRQRKLALSETLDALLTGVKRQIGAIVADDIRSQQEQVAALVARLGGQVTNRIRVQNALAVIVRADAIGALESSADVLWIAIDERRPGFLKDSICTIGADSSFWANGVTGTVYEGGILDSGIDESHPGFAGMSFQGTISLSAASGDVSFDDDVTDSDDLQGHGTHVAGIVCSNDATYRGVAYDGKSNLNLKAAFLATDGLAYMVDSDAMAAVDFALFDAADDADVFNLSYGGSTTSDDSSYDRFWDSVVEDTFTQAVFAAGNDGPTGTVGSPGLSHNGICVANIKDKNDCTANDEWDSSSSIGPTPGFRGKPDIGAPGHKIDSANNKWEGLSANYVNKTGTSMAAPHVAGACLLLADYGVIAPRAQKALLLNTADDIEGIGVWNKYYGFGALDLDHAWFHRDDVHTNYIYDETHDAADRFRLYAGKMFNGDRATAVYHRQADYTGGYPTSFYDLNTLTLYAYRESDEVTLDADSGGIDNVCAVEYTDVSSTDAVLKIRSFGTFDPADYEYYSLATEEGFSEVEVATTCAISAIKLSPTLLQLNITVTNTGDVKAHDIDVTAGFPSKWSTLFGLSTTLSAGDIEPGASDTVSWLLTRPAAPPFPLPVVLTADATSNSYGETFTSDTTIIFTW